MGHKRQFNPKEQTRHISQSALLYSRMYCRLKSIWSWFMEFIGSPALYRKSSHCLLWVAYICLVLVSVRLFARIFFNCIDIFACWKYIQVTRALLVNNISKQAMSGVFTMLGIVNYFFLHVISARKRNLYSIRLSDVMSDLFRWNGHTYITYGLLVIEGLYCAWMGYFLSGMICFGGVVAAFWSTGIVASSFEFNPKKTLAMVDYYLTKENKRTGKLRYVSLITICTYIHDRYQETQEVSREVFRSLVTHIESEPLKLEGLPYDIGDANQKICYLCCPTESGSNQFGVLTSIYNARFLCERIFSGFDVNHQASLLRKIAAVLGQIFENEKDSNPILDKLKSGTNLFLCGCAAYFRAAIDGTPTQNLPLDSIWDTVMNVVLLAKTDLPAQVDGDVQVDVVNKLMIDLVKLLICAGIVEMSTCKAEKLSSNNPFEILIRACKRFSISFKDLSKSFPAGQAILTASGHYMPKVHFIDSYETLNAMQTTFLS